jgi:putative MATE family efflux protein
VILTGVFYFAAPTLLRMFGASDVTLPYAVSYARTYILGSICVLVVLGMNPFITTQGFAKISMMTTVIGAVINIILDPIFIFGMDMGVAGAALATVISQAASAMWVLRFLLGKKILIPLQRKNITIRKDITRDICKLGTANFIMQGTNCLVQVACNTTLQTFGGDLYVGIMTVTNSVREIFSLPVSGVGNGAQPVISYNYGAKRYARVRAGIRFNTAVGAVYTMVAWLAILLFPRFWFGIFSDDPAMLQPGIEAMNIYFFGFVFMAFQFAGQTTFQALGDAKHAIFFSLLRKAIIVAPLTVLLPRLGFGVLGVFMAEPVSNVIGGLACYLTMRATAYKKIENAIKASENP